MGCGQVVRHQVLVLAFGGSNPSTPAMKNALDLSDLRHFSLSSGRDPNSRLCVAKRRGVRQSERNPKSTLVFFLVNERRNEDFSKEIGVISFPFLKYKQLNCLWDFSMFGNESSGRAILARMGSEQKNGTAFRSCYNFKEGLFNG